MMTHDIYIVDGVVCTRCKWFLMREKRKYAIYRRYWDPASDEEEMQYISKAEQVEDGEVFRETRLMVCDLMTIKSKR